MTLVLQVLFQKVFQFETGVIATDADAHVLTAKGFGTRRCIKGRSTALFTGRSFISGFHR